MELPLSVISASGLNSDAYKSLRHEVHRLKGEHTQLQGARKTAKQLEKLAVLQQQNELRLQQEQYQTKISQLQASLQEANDRCGKIRLQYERSQRILQAKADKLAKRIEEEHGSVQSCTDALNQQHTEQVHRLECQIEEAHQVQVTERVAYEAEQQQLQLKAAEWCEQQIQSERSKAADAMAAANAMIREWQTKCERYQDSLLESQQHHDSTKDELKQAQLDNTIVTADVDRLRQEAADVKQAHVELQAQLDTQQKAWHEQHRKLMVEHNAQASEQSQRKVQEMNAVHERFKQVVQKKDASHSALLAQHKDMQLQCRRYEEVLRQQQVHLQQLAGP